MLIGGCCVLVVLFSLVGGFLFGLIYFGDFNLIIYYIVGFGLEFCMVLFGFGLLVFVLLFSLVV